MSSDLNSWLHSKNIPTSRSTPYNLAGNGQCEMYNASIWKAITPACRSRHLDVKCWEMVLPDALHSIRSLLCIATNTTPHERLFNFARRSASRQSLPSWLAPGTVYLKRHNRQSKYEPFVDEVELLEANPNYAHIRYNNGRESAVSLSDLAPCAQPETQNPDSVPQETVALNDQPETMQTDAPPSNTADSRNFIPCRSQRVRRPPERLDL